MPSTIPIRHAGRIIRAGGVVAYPTEGVWGLGCLPQAELAVQRILDIKQRSAAKGLILIAAEPRQLESWIAPGIDAATLTSDSANPVTWIVPAADWVPYLVRGDNEGIAVRITTHPVAAALCFSADSAIVSTSANISGRPSLRSPYALRRTLGHLVDCVVAGHCGPAGGASEIRDWRSGRILRPA
ncbi:MAG: L-threonylcarbamoyladenylate synthase, partial [Woeseiaceae bacterium]